MHRLVPSLVGEMGAAYPELIRAQPLIEETLKLEETRFRQTLERGLKLLDEATACAEAMTAAPTINSRWHEDALEVFDAVHVGIGTALGEEGVVDFKPYAVDPSAEQALDFFLSAPLSAGVRNFGLHL